MPSLPFTFEDVKNLDIKAKADEAKANKQNTPDINAQEFLGEKINNLKERYSDVDGVIDVGMAINPVLRYTDMASKFFGGPGVAQGFKDGVTQPVGDERSGQSEIRLPPMPF